MGYSKEIYTEVISELAQQHQSAIATAEKREYELFRNFPHLKNIIDEQNKTGLRLSRMLLQEPKRASEIISEHKKIAEEFEKKRNELLSSIGLPHDYLDPPFLCKKCSDKGYINGVKCECLDKKLRDKAHEKLNKISNLKLCTFHNFDTNLYPDSIDEGNMNTRERMRRYYDYCYKYAYEFSISSGNILMMGGTGLGKTHLSLAIAKSVLDNGYGVVYASAPNLFSELEKSKFSNQEKNNGLLNSVLECDLLILDDLGAEFHNNFSTSTMYTIVNSRINYNIPTIINTNLTHPELQDVYTQRIVSRLISTYSVLHFYGEDIRFKNKTIRKI